MTPIHNTCRWLALVAILLVGTGLTPSITAQEPESAAEKAFHEARQLYDNGNMAEALAAFQHFEDEYKFSIAIPQAIHFQGWCWANSQKYQDAIDTFVRLITNYPTSALIPVALLKQAECYRELKNYAKAIELYQRFETNYPKHELLPRAMLGEAWTLFLQNDLGTSQEVAEKIRTQVHYDPDVSLDISFLVGQIRIAEKDYDGAHQILGQIIPQRDDPRATQGFFQAGEAMFNAKRYADAIPYYESVQSTSGALARVHEQINNLEPQRAAYQQREELALYELNLSDLRQLEVRFRTGPDLHASALFRVADCQRLLGHPQEATKAFRELLKAYPNDKLAEQAQFALIQVLTDHHQLDEADVETGKFQTKYPNGTFATEALFLQAETLFGSGRFQEALDHFRQFAAINKNPQLRETTDFHIAACYYGLRDFDKARDGFLVFLKQNPDSKMVPEALLRLGRSYFELSQKATDSRVVQADLTDAITNYEEIRAKFPTSELLPEVTFQLGYLHAYLAAQDVDKMGNFAKAVASFQEFVTRWPDNRLVPEALYQIARNQSAQGKFDAAVVAYKQLVEKYPDNTLTPFAIYEIAGCYAGQKKPAEMIAALRDFVKRYPNHERVGNALYTIASQLEADKKPHEAIDGYRNVISRAAAAPHPADDLLSAAIASETRIASILENRDATTDAVKDCESFLSKFKNEPAAVHAVIVRIASTYRKAKKFGEAYARLDQLTTQYPQNANVRVATTTSTIELALAEMDTRHAYTAALKLLADPEKDHLPSTSYIAIGNALLGRGQFAQAQDAFQASLARYPNDTRTAPLAQLGSGESALGLNKLDNAETAFNQVIAANPQGPALSKAELGLAKVYLSRGNDRYPIDANSVRAIDLLNKIMANAKGEDAGEAAYLLGDYFFNFKANEEDNKKTALAYYLRVALLTSGPHGEEAAFRSGQCHQALGNVAAARSAFQAYLRRFPNGQFAADTKKALESLPPQEQPS